MKKHIIIFSLVLMFILTPLLLAGCTKETITDGIKLSDIKIVVTDGHDSDSNNEYKTLKFTCVVENTTDQTISFEVVFSYRSGSLLSMSTKNPKQEITLSPGESRSLTYTTDKIYGGIIDQKKIFIQNVN